MTSWYSFRSSRGNPQAAPPRARRAARAGQPGKLSDTSRRILLKTSRRSAFAPRYMLSDEPRYIEPRVTSQSAPTPFAAVLPAMYQTLFGNRAHPQAFFQSRAGLVFMTVSWLSALSYLYNSSTPSSWMYPFLHSMDGLSELSPPVYYATATGLLLMNSFVTAYAAEVIGRYVGGALEGMQEKITGVKNSEWLSRRVPITEPTHGPLRPDDPYAAFQRPLYSTSMPLEGPTMESMKPGRFLQTNAGLVFLTVVWFALIGHLYRTADGGKWYYSFLHALDGLDQLSRPAYYLAAAALILAHSYATAFVADRLAYAFADTIDAVLQRVRDAYDAVRGRYAPKSRVPEADGYSSAAIPRMFQQGQYGTRSY